MNEKNLRQAMDRRLSSLKTEARHVENVLQTAQGEKAMKRKPLSLALVFVLIAAAGLAIAAIVSPTIDFFSWIYGKKEGQRYEADLKGGIRMPVDETWVLGEVQYHLQDAVYVEKSQDNELMDNTLYGTITISPLEGKNIVFLLEDYSLDEAYGYNRYHGQEVPAGARSIAQTAQERGARIILPKAVPVEVYADGQVLEGDAIGGETGYLPDGRIIYSFVISAPKAREYSLSIQISNWEVRPDGSWMREEPDNTWLRELKEVKLKPE